MGAIAGSALSTRLRCLPCALAALAFLALPGAASAAILQVANTSDSGQNSLRQAIHDANSLSGPDRINITATGTINLQSELPHINSSMTIAGPGFGKLNIHRDPGANPSDLYSIFTVKQGIGATISGVTISGGAGTSGRGGGIYNSGALTLVNSVVSHNTVSSGNAQGGGIYNLGVLTLVHSAVAANVAGNASSPGLGGGIENDPTFGASISLNAGSLISKNRALGPAAEAVGSARSAGPSTSSTAPSPTTSRTGSAAASTPQDNGTVSLIRSTIADNRTNGTFGGGISMQSGAHVNIDRSTMSGNVATDSSNFGIGGAIEANDGVLDISNSTIAASKGGLVATIRTGATTTVNSSIIGDPVGGVKNCDLLNGGTFTSSGHNVVSDTSCFAPKPSDQVKDPKLKPLAYNGGPTFTMALKPSSPAIGAGDPATCGTIDQRLLPIANDGNSGCDSGSFEFYAKPRDTKKPKIKGKPKKGHTLKCKKGTWKGGTPITYAYQWYRGHKKIGGETAKTHEVHGKDSGHSLRCKVTATNPGGKSKAKSKKVRVS